MYVLAVLSAAHCGIAVLCWRQIARQVYETFAACEIEKKAMHKGAATKCIAANEIGKQK
jgi:hypothetical protein